MTRIVGDWEIGDTIGQGGMGIVYSAHHRLVDGEFAIKMLRPELARDPTIVRRFLAEVQKARLLDHPNIVRMEIPFRHASNIYLPMEMLRGRPLSDLMDDEPGPWPVDRTIDQIRQAATGLGHAHARNILHRDVKPENLFVSSVGRVKLLDFGLAKLIGEKSLTGQGMAVGTPVYMAPEVLRGVKPSAASDLYSLGVIMFRLLTGRLPIPVQDTSATLAEIFGPVLHAHEQGLPRPSSIKPGLPVWLDDLSARLLDRNPEVRPQNGAALASILEQHPVRADGSSPASSSGPEIMVAGYAPGTPASGLSISGSSPAFTALPRTPSHAPTPMPPPRPSWIAPVSALVAGVAGFGLALALSVNKAPVDKPLAAPARAGQAQVQVTFSSDPEGAFVMLGDRVACDKTPCTASVEAGHGTVVMRLDRHEVYKAVIDIGPEQRGFHARLKAAYGRINILTRPPGVGVLVDGTSWGATPIHGRELGPGMHQVQIHHRKFKPVSRVVRITAGETTTVNTRLIPLKAAAPTSAPADAATEGFEHPLFKDYDDNDKAKDPGGRATPPSSPRP